MNVHHFGDTNTYIYQRYKMKKEPKVNFAGWWHPSWSLKRNFHHVVDSAKRGCKIRKKSYRVEGHEGRFETTVLVNSKRFRMMGWKSIVFRGSSWLLKQVIAAASSRHFARTWYHILEALDLKDACNILVILRGNRFCRHFYKRNKKKVWSLLLEKKTKSLIKSDAGVLLVHHNLFKYCCRFVTNASNKFPCTWLDPSSVHLNVFKSNLYPRGDISVWRRCRSHRIKFTYIQIL